MTIQTRLFVIFFKSGDIDAAENSFDKDYMQLSESKRFNVLIDKKPFF